MKLTLIIDGIVYKKMNLFMNSKGVKLFTPAEAIHLAIIKPSPKGHSPFPKG